MPRVPSIFNAMPRMSATSEISRVPNMWVSFQYTRRTPGPHPGQQSLELSTHGQKPPNASCTNRTQCPGEWCTALLDFELDAWRFSDSRNSIVMYCAEFLIMWSSGFAMPEEETLHHLPASPGGNLLFRWCFSAPTSRATQEATTPRPSEGTGKRGPAHPSLPCSNTGRETSVSVHLLAHHPLHDHYSACLGASCAMQLARPQQQGDRDSASPHAPERHPEGIHRPERVHDAAPLHVAGHAGLHRVLKQ